VLIIPLKKRGGGKKMERKEKLFLNRDVTVRKVDGTYVRGICTAESELGLALLVQGSVRKKVFIPFSQINEIVTGE
jgi:hypothetical protein